MTYQRQAERRDVPGIQRVRRAVRENRLTSGVITDDQVVAAIEVTGRGWVVVDEREQVLGFAIGNAVDGNIWALFVDPEHERRGHGRRLHDEMVAWLWSRGLGRLWLSTTPHTRAQGFYERAGWTSVGLLANGEVRFEKRNPMQLADFPITRKWPAIHPERIQLYSMPTPNGVKVSIALEELGLAYEPHRVSFDTHDQMSPEFLSVSPNNKIPAIIDPDGPGAKALALFESGAILVYLAEKTGRLMSCDAATRYETLQWVMFQMGGIGPMFGQVGFFVKFAGKDFEDKRPRERYVAEARRLLGVLDRHLQGRDWIVADEYSIADIATFPWIRNLVGFYGAGEMVGFDAFTNVKRVLEVFVARPAVQAGLDIPKKG